MNGGNANEFAKLLLDTCDLHDFAITPPLRARICENETDRYAFIFNYSDGPVNGHIRGYGFDEAVTVASNDVAVLCKPKTV